MTLNPKHFPDNNEKTLGTVVFEVDVYVIGKLRNQAFREMPKKSSHFVK